MDSNVNNFVTVPLVINLFKAAVCQLVCLFFLLFGWTALIGGVKEHECEVQVNDITPTNMDRFPWPIGGGIDGVPLKSLQLLFFCHSATLLLDG